MSKETLKSYPLRTRLAGTGLAILTGTTALVGCSSHAATTPKHSEQATSQRSSGRPTPSQSLSTHESVVNPPSVSPSESTSRSASTGVVSVEQVTSINMCAPGISQVVAKGLTDKQDCESNLSGQHGYKNESFTAWYDDKMEEVSRDNTNFTAMIDVNRLGKFQSNPFKDQGSAADVGFFEGHKCYYSYNDTPLTEGLYCLLNNDGEQTPDSPLVQVYITNQGQFGVQGTYQMHEDMMAATLEYLNKKVGGISLSGKNEVPPIVQNYGVNTPLPTS